MARTTFLDLIRMQWRTVPPVVHADLSGKTMMVIGSSGGLGLEAAKHLAKMGPAKLVLTARDEARGTASVQELKRDTGYDAELRLVDLAKLSSDCQVTPQLKMDLRLPVNYLSAVIVTLSFLPLLTDTANKYGVRPRIVQVVSDTGYWNVGFDDEVMHSGNVLRKLSEPSYCNPRVLRERYALSKTLNSMFIKALNEHLPPTSPVICASVNPGYCISGLRRHLSSGVAGLMFTVMDALLARTTEQGSRQIVFAAVGHADAEDSLKGAYISLDYAFTEESDYMCSAEGAKAQKKLWNDTLDTVREVFPDLASVVADYLTI
ncbi:NAD(P)-binding protein [Punctularia strigosozonata HHB-11173 SS5]|uniref:NAD(P)-binding protein n=1 Tax=Punctularia strigosozonata (strain HHB-11173) TaxID=741275 RepID=UPI0004416D1C|nr:NAD(P)-binding protein [Punctularia strigosozonata HHB-11173 SS5]EIN14745.1 NAD(P)-binding protein [Punctularia strigosozonata HHB-11173 SS5]